MQYPYTLALQTNDSPCSSLLLINQLDGLLQRLAGLADKTCSLLFSDTYKLTYATGAAAGYRVKSSTPSRRGHLPAGAKFGRLAVTERSGSDAAGRAMFRCRCDCGSECLVRGADLRSGHSKSCGCLRKSAPRDRRVYLHLKTFGNMFVLGKGNPEEHGPRAVWVLICRYCGRAHFARRWRVLKRNKQCDCLGPTKISWLRMRERCTDKNHAQYKDYGGRGIRVCERWQEDFSEFVKDMGRRPEGKTLDRIDNDRGYEPSNCRWATAEEQAQSRRKPTRDV